MKKYFNTSGPCHPNKHYMLPAQERCRGLLSLIEREQYFVIHAARQSGKTTLLLDLVRQLNDSGDYHALYCSLESVYGIIEPEKGVPAVVRELAAEIELHEPLEKYHFAGDIRTSDFNTMLRMSLSRFCKLLDRPLVILFDEVDCLSDGTLISFLRQLRYGYVNRARAPFAHSAVLVGMRNIRDYKAGVRDDRDTLGSSSPFNIAKVSKTIRNFNQEEVTRLYAQHAEQTGQLFSPEVTKAVYDCTRGQPWLVNALADEIVEQILEQDFSRPVTADHVEQAVETIVRRRDTHIDSLMERLKEKRVQRFVEPVITGEIKGHDPLDDDYQYVLDLGLLRKTDRRLIPSNPIYNEVIIRYLSIQVQSEMDMRGFPPAAPAYLADGKLDMRRLLGDFQQFWRENSEIWQERYQYKEAAPHLVMQAFLQRVINAGGRISRELAEGTGRLDLCVRYDGFSYPIELKLRHGDRTYETGKKQLARYMDKMGCAEGWLVVFDRRRKPTWDDRIFWRTDGAEGKTIHTVGC